ncbi:Pentachlorophenol 4-monooxygenase [Streptomyces sp. ADI96-02]|uniref:FAD-dependent monooxygenase n=1 Tax=unclassified Streptomyces TaxID=2593676 RepID=UPI000F55825D|nr:FAD-dependent monooxygenase [Streptomyces sp. ADI96-02]RPK69189.1 Pentachlorophenol 4-monooxygenase [Streptomyces sp. ADI96-02]
MRTEIIVVGAGPTGLMLAHELTLAGVPAVVLERQRTRSVQSRAGGLQPRTAEVLDLRGLLDPLLVDAPVREETGGHFATLPVELDCRSWRTRHPYPVRLPQARLEERLEQLLAERGVPVLRGRQVTSVAQDEDGVSVEWTADDGAAGTIRGSHLVACDGAHSTVRTLLGVPFSGRAGRMSAVAADLTLATRSAEVPTGHGHFSQYPRSANGFLTILHPIGPDLYRLLFGKLTGDGPDREAPVSADEVREALHAVYGPGTELGELRAASRFSDAVRQVERYREGRVFFAGDAAHIHMPIGGQGVNLGVQDAINLGWKLAGTIHGWAPAGLLDSYHEERHPVAARVLRHTRAQAVIMNPGRDEEVDAVRELVTDLLRLPDTNHYVSGMMSGLDVRYAGVGPRLIDVDLTTDEGPTRVSRLMHSGRGLLLSLDGRRRSAGDRSDRVDHVVAKTDEDVDGAGALLIRPDGYVAWADTDDSPLETALARWFG